MDKKEKEENKKGDIKRKRELQGKERKRQKEEENITTGQSSFKNRYPSVVAMWAFCANGSIVTKNQTFKIQVLK